MDTIAYWLGRSCKDCGEIWWMTDPGHRETEEITRLKTIMLALAV